MKNFIMGSLWLLLIIGNVYLLFADTDATRIDIILRIIWSLVGLLCAIRSYTEYLENRK